MAEAVRRGEVRDRRTLELLEAIEARSYLGVPLRAGNRVVGTLVLANTTSGRFFEVDDVAFVAQLGERAGLVLDNARLMEAEHEIARELQQRLLPSSLPVPSSVGVAARYQAAHAQLGVRGDWYDVAELADGRLAVAVGDIVGHGPRAAATMGQLRSAFAALAPAAVGPAELLDRLDTFCARGASRRRSRRRPTPSATLRGRAERPSDRDGGAYVAPAASGRSCSPAGSRGSASCPSAVDARALRPPDGVERVNREIDRRTDLVGIFPNDHALIRLAGMRLVERDDCHEETRTAVSGPSSPCRTLGACQQPLSTRGGRHAVSRHRLGTRRAAWCAINSDGRLTEGTMSAGRGRPDPAGRPPGPDARGCIEMMSGAVWGRGITALPARLCDVWTTRAASQCPRTTHDWTPRSKTVVARCARRRIVARLVA